jgi:hypothetical protein
LAELNAFLKEVEQKQGDTDGWWEQKPNTQLLAMVSEIGRGNLSFYTGKNTLLIQGKEAAHIRQRFLEWRAERLARIEAAAAAAAALAAAEDGDEERLRATKRRKVGARTRKAIRAACEHCHRLLDGPDHPRLDGLTLCASYEGKYKCGCGRWWYGQALKIQDKHPCLHISTAESFPGVLYPDCRECLENFSVVLEKPQLKERRGRDGERARRRRHQSHCCQMCKAGKYCARA